ncbi:MAG: thioredoxin fold domain-containing protein [Ignavibacteriaceae bacterium]|nr:thioredoxin fold domain-containing protein [Ignavibacteriaceae bacterium]
MKKFFQLFTVLLIFISPGIQSQPGFGENLVEIKAYSSFDNVYVDGEFKLAVKLKIKESWHINSDKPKEDFLIASIVSIDTSDNNFKVVKTYYPKAKDYKLSFSETPLSVWDGEVTIGALIKVNENIKPGNYKLIVNFDYQACNDMSCLAPNSVQDTLEINIVEKSAVVNEINQDIFKDVDLSFSQDQKNSTADDDSLTSTLESKGIILGLILVFLGGLALNLTPCVYPLIPITIGYFGGQSEGRTGRLFLMGLLFVLGMSVTYSVIGVVTALSGAVFGALLQNTYVIIAIAAIFIILSLSMFGVYEFKLPNALVAKAGGAKGGLYGAFFMGLTMGIVAAPCIGPFVLGLVTYVAAKADPYYGFLLFFVLALGLGFPYLFLAIFSGKIKKLPRAGEWMEAVKHIFGFILIGMAIYFLLPLLPDSVAGYVLPVYMILVALYLVLIDKLSNNVLGFRIFKIVFSLVLIAVAVYSLIPSKSNSVEWIGYSESISAEYKNNGKPTIIDFYADWCIPCKELDALTFSDPKVIDDSKRFNTFKADMTKSLSPEVESLRKKYSIVGVPTVLVIDSKGNEVNRITGFVNAEEFYSIISKVN